MKPRLTTMVIIVLALALAFSLGSQLTRAQVATSPPQYQLSAENLPAATVMGDDVSIQGRLTDTSGKPVDGFRYITASIYDVISGGTARCQSQQSIPVSVTNGLFSMVVSGCTPTDFNGAQLYLGIKVGADEEMSPRHRLNAVPYAWALRPGSQVRGASSNLWIPGAAALKTSDAEFTSLTAAAVKVLARCTVQPTTEIGQSIVIPVTIPSTLYGVHTRVTGITVYYESTNGDKAYIAETELIKETGYDALHLVHDFTDRKGTVAGNYYLSTDPAINTLDLNEGVGVVFRLVFGDNTSFVIIYGVRLTLQHDY